MGLDRVRTNVRFALAAALVAFVLLVLGRRREERATGRKVERLLGNVHDQRPETPVDDDLDDLPDPVRRYFETVFQNGVPETDTVRIDQEGTLRLGGPASPWKRFTATHHATVGQPGFVWDAAVELAPLVSIRIRDALVDGDGSARVTLFGALPIAGATPSPELNEAALQRYLAEAPWYPTALLPRNGVTWEPIDDRSARATIEAGETSASLVVSFTGADEIERVHTERRYRRVDDGFEPTPWTGLWRAYEDRSGVRVPTEGEVVWHLPDGDLHAWRGRVCEIERRP